MPKAEFEISDLSSGGIEAVNAGTKLRASLGEAAVAMSGLQVHAHRRDCTRQAAVRSNESYKCGRYVGGRHLVKYRMRRNILHV